MGALGLGAALALAFFAPARDGAAGAPAPGAAGPVALVATPAREDATASEVRVVQAGAGGAPAREVLRVAIAHARGAVLRGDVLASGAVVVVADEAGAPDPDWGAALHRVDARGARVLARGVYHASRPLASTDGRVYVERGTSGRWPTPEEARAGRLRTDALTLDAIDPETADARTVTTWTGYTLHLAGELGGELVVYRVAPEGAELAVVDRASGLTRVVTPLLPFARDFSMDRARGAVVMSNRDAADSRLWTVERVDLRTGARERLYEQRDEAPVPWLTHDGDVRWSRSAAAASPDAPFVARLAGPDERVAPLAGALR